MAGVATQKSKPQIERENKEIMSLHLNNIGQIIQLSIAPVFLLTGVGTQMSVLTHRLARIIDRSRNLENLVHVHGTEYLTEHVQLELEELYKRSHLINRAITLSSSCALLICLVIASLFLGDALDKDLGNLIAVLFVLGVLALIGSFVYFLREIFVATKTLDRQRELGARYLPMMKQIKDVKEPNGTIIDTVDKV